MRAVSACRAIAHGDGDAAAHDDVRSGKYGNMDTYTTWYVSCLSVFVLVPTLRLGKSAPNQQMPRPAMGFSRPIRNWQAVGMALAFPALEALLPSCLAN